jgi:hypothetical protein
VPLDRIQVVWGGNAVGRKALAYPAARRIEIDPAFWRSIRTVDGRAAILAHERAHIEGARCESCADRRAGEILRREGHPTPRDAARVMAGRLENRDADRAAADLLDGYGLDDLPTGAGYLLYASRAVGVRAPKVLAFLASLHREGLTYQGQRYSVAVGVDGGLRDDARQLQLYAKGRQLVGDAWHVVDRAAVVTNARTARETRHGQGRAVDLWPMLPGGAPLLRREQAPNLFDGLYAALGEAGERHGLAWGGRWKSLVDLPHFEDPTFTLADAAPVGALVALVLLTLALTH